jgi:hypothetical protein
MANQPMKSSKAMLVGRGAADAAQLCDPSSFAWEILRRRNAYRAQTNVITGRSLGRAGAMVEIIDAPSPDPIWGLQFR